MIFNVAADMPRYDDRRSITRLYVGHLSSRTRTRDLEDLFARYGRVRAVDMKRYYAFVEFGDPHDADDAGYSLDGREFKGSRIVVEFSGGHHEALGDRWARDCKAGDWKNKCYRCGERGHIERNCQNSPKKLRFSLILFFPSRIVLLDHIFPQGDPILVVVGEVGAAAFPEAVASISLPCKEGEGAEL
ncbi:hypothetical protein MLD38_002605 [Melastoma candidum]|uniref:Uncharacterized protein n=1 Tax=Melastoma candidum TaxID=119954 RepID=A0ACB9RZI6_9MYRT|nr:hypothetical protein MLD38_002605 [Melastoma candidum]